MTTPPDPDSPLPKINIKFKNREETISFDEEIAEIRLGDSEWQRIGEVIDNSDKNCIDAINNCICLHSAYIKKIGRLACMLGGIAVILGVIALLSPLWQ